MQILVTHYLNLLRNISKCPAISNKFIFRIWILTFIRVHFRYKTLVISRKRKFPIIRNRCFILLRVIMIMIQVLYGHGLLRKDIPLIIHFVLECRTHNFYIKRWTFSLKSCSYDKNKEITCSLFILTLCKNLKVIYISYLSINVQQSYILIVLELSRENLLFFSTIHLGYII